MTTNTYTVTIYKSLTGRFCIRHPLSKSGVHYIAHQHFASRDGARRFCKRQGWAVAK